MMKIPEDFIVIPRRPGEVTPEQREHIFHVLDATIDDVLAREGDISDDD